MITQRNVVSVCWFTRLTYGPVRIDFTELLTRPFHQNVLDAGFLPSFGLRVYA